jgi:signal transduction histidine kinase
MKTIAILCAIILFLLTALTCCLYNFARRHRFIKAMQTTLQNLQVGNKAYLLSEMLDRPTFAEGAAFYDILATTAKTVADNVLANERQMHDFRDYIELWVHEVKTPLTGLKLGGRKLPRAAKIQLDEIENYINQALFYAKLGAAEKDYVVKPVNLHDIANSVVRQNKDALIEHKIKVELDFGEGAGKNNANTNIKSDPKWLEFIVNQIILNAIKYRKTTGKNTPAISFSTQKIGGNTAFVIRDNGIGIDKTDLPRVLEKGFTGSNGRERKASTGMGLYIASRLAADLGHQIEVASAAGKWTEARIVFGNDDFLNPDGNAEQK